MPKPTKQPFNNETFFTVLKVIMITYIIMSPFIQYQYVSFLDNMIVKVLILVAIIVACFMDFQLAIVMTIAFVIFIINVNTSIIESVKKNIQSDLYTNFPLPSKELQYIRETLPSQDPMETADNVQCTNASKTDINNDLVNHYIDPKIKPYEVFISMLSDPGSLDNIQNGSVLDQTLVS